MLPATSPNAATALLEAIVDGLRLSSIFNFEPILNLPNATLVKDHPLYKLLWIFTLGQGFAQYKAGLGEYEPEFGKNSAYHRVLSQ